MKKKDIRMSLLALAGMAACLAYAGNEDIKDEVIDSMSYETYAEVVDNLPDGATRADIVEEYLETRERSE